MKNLKKLTRQQMQIVNGGINCVWDTGYCPGNTVCQAPPGLSDYSSYRCRQSKEIKTIIKNFK